MWLLAFAGSKVAGHGIATYAGRPMRLSVLCAVAFIVSALPLRAEDTAVVRAADGFQLPVGPNGTGEGYYIARGYRPNGHLGEDWNGVHGGNTDLGDPVYAIASGYVMFARNYHVGWGNVVILRHAYYEGSTLKFCDSLYGHLLDFSVQEGEQVHRGQQIGRIGNNFGMYEAHLHFEMRKNLQIGMFRSSFARDFSNYFTPNEFVATHHACPNGNHMANIPINTYPPVAPPVVAGPHVESPVFGPPPAGAPPRFARVSPLPPPARVVPSSTPEPGSVEARIERSLESTTSFTSTPIPSGKHSAKPSTALAAASPPPSSSKKGSKAPAPIADAPATPAPLANKRTRQGQTPAPATANRPETETIESDPLLPAPTTTNVVPIQRSGSGFKVDRFGDMRGKGY
ncbi:peptidase M23B [Chthoniobacter flavus Ellin428]|uniref:Peptidase M23B n=2 Tax=Chthoniobacter flavus TaxID=191863 RepID=B4DBG0_9BACT|nr:peptidase M23B [Chthoniobacter flavus Ellin428]TCO84364.1 peptidase M23-like protein [Chthoniobacter flavus]